MRSAKEFENDVGALLDVLYARFDAAKVRIRQSLKYRSEKQFRSYSPIIDITVGPFAEERGISLWAEYDSLVRFSHDLINEMLASFRINYQNFGEGYFQIHERTLPNNSEDFLSNGEDVNWNARCFMAIEVEDSGSRKHLLGDMINASISGRIGILVGYNDDKYKTFLRHLDYLAYTVRARKIRFSSKNIIVLKPEQLENILFNNLDTLQSP